MKRLFLKAIPFGIAFLFSTASHAQVSQEVRDFYDSTVVTNDTMWFYVEAGGSHAWDFRQTNIGSSTVTYRFQKVYVQMQPGANALFCVAPNDGIAQCFSPTQFMSSDFVTDPGDFNRLICDFNALSSAPGISVVRYHMFDYNNPADSVNVTLIYNVTPVGIAEGFGENSLGEPYPNPSNGIFNIPAGSSDPNASVVVTNSLGDLVAENQVTSSLITIDGTMWSEGIYFVTLVSENGEVISRRKLVRN